MPAARKSLNAHIDAVHRIFLRHDPNSPRSLAGVDDDHWHAKVVASAVQGAGYHFRKLDLAAIDLAAELATRRGTFLIDGTLNDTYVDERGAAIQTDPTDETTAAQEPARWRHAVAVVNGVVREQQHQEVELACLHLNADGRPDATKGYMREILKVYRIWQCTGGEGCRGVCMS